MKRIGIIGGISWQSTLSYYRLLNEGVNARLGGHHTADLIIHSGDFDQIVDLQEANRWEDVAEILVEAAKTLASGGAELLVIASNTSHMAAEQIEQGSDLPVVHIVDATAERVAAVEIDSVALIGTKPTMSADFYRRRMSDKGIKTVVPDDDAQTAIHRIIFDELVHGVVEDSSRRLLSDVVDSLADNGAEGVVLGCTELGMLAGEDDFVIPGFDSTRIHVDAVLEMALGK